MRTVATVTAPVEAPRNTEAVLAFAAALLGPALPLLFVVALVAGRVAVQQAVQGAPHRGLAAVGYSIGWIGTGFGVVLILVLAVGTVFGL